jgi:hypothetical protein
VGAAEVLDGKKIYMRVMAGRASFGSSTEVSAEVSTEV